MEFHENFVVDNSGHRVAVMLPIKDYDKLLEALEELEEIKAFDKAKSKKETTILLKEAIKLRRKK